MLNQQRAQESLSQWCTTLLKGTLESQCASEYHVAYVNPLAPYYARKKNITTYPDLTGAAFLAIPAIMAALHNANHNAAHPQNSTTSHQRSSDGTPADCALGRATGGRACCSL